MLPAYFRTFRVNSFIRQLYIYNFRTIKINKKKEYHNSDFIRGRYSDIVKVKKGTKSSLEQDIGIDDTYHEYIKLSKNYDELWMAVLDLKERTNEIILANHALIMKELNERFDFIDRVKSTLISFVLQVLYFDEKTNEKVKSLVEKTAENDELKQESTFKSFEKMPDIPETVKSEIHKAFFEFNGKHSKIAKVLHLILKSFNRRFFGLEYSKFYDIVIRFFVRDEDPLHLYRLPNYHILSNLKKSFKEFIDIVIGEYFPDVLKPLYDKIQKIKEVEMLISQDEARVMEKILSDSFSVRTLRNQIGFIDLDLFSYIGIDLDC